MESQDHNNSDRSETLKAHLETWKHIDLAMRLLMSAQINLTGSAVTPDDRAKLVSPGEEKFARVMEELRSLTYGSPEYEEYLYEVMGQAPAHHCTHNDHPEFFEQQEECGEIYDYQLMLVRTQNDPLISNREHIYQEDYQGLIYYLIQKQAEHTSPANNMNLFDILKMFLHWTGASQRRANGDINESIKEKADRCALSPQLLRIFQNTIPLVHDSFSGSNNQNDAFPPQNPDIPQ